ncbi:YbfB/YjiJ family MFS transporter [Fodinicola feengrottensis]|uniref:YbfB/YjiJ family MFS transporter n=1 Tax=Fodinicola feengrottensis TaxID=435914 RepID=UPI0013D203AE|nr:YbfB/YjiJ family MFS transporter [Fodinicola feengrottensis]
MVAHASTRPAASQWGGALVLLIAGLTAASAAVNGLGRFAYALVLPSMRADLHWSYATAGLLNTVNAAGYLTGALLAAPVAARLGHRRALLAALVVSALAVLAASVSGLVPVLLILRLTSGIAGAIAFIAGGALTAALTRRPATASRGVVPRALLHRPRSRHRGVGGGDPAAGQRVRVAARLGDAGRALSRRPGPDRGRGPPAAGRTPSPATGPSAGVPRYGHWCRCW